jgi:hypothetical protein
MKVQILGSDDIVSPTDYWMAAGTKMKVPSKMVGQRVGSCSHQILRDVVKVEGSSICYIKTSGDLIKVRTALNKLELGVRSDWSKNVWSFSHVKKINGNHAKALEAIIEGLIQIFGEN